MKFPSLALIPILVMSAGVAGVSSGPASAQDGERSPDADAPGLEIQTVFPQRRRPRVVDRAWKPVEVKSVDAEVLISGETARTELEVKLFNPSSRPARCELVVPVPAGAAVSGFGLDGLEGDPPSRLLPIDEARAAFEEIVRKMIDPGLLEFAGSGLIRSSVFPVPAGGEQTLRVTYEQAVDGEGDEIEYRLPRSGSAGASPEWTVSVRVDAARPIVSAFSSSHAVEFDIEDGDAVLEDAKLSGAGDFRFVALRESRDGPSMSLFTYPDLDSPTGGFFMLVMAAGERGPEESPVPREVTLVLDRSGSMQGEKFEQARAAALQVIRALGPGERFRLIDYSSDVSSGEDSATATDESIQRAAARLEAMKAVGGTNINGALMAAVRPSPAEGALPIVLFLTDGLPTVGVTDEKSIRENVLQANAGERRLFTFGVGEDVNVPLLTDLARESRAAADFVSPGEDVEAAVGRVFDRLRGPVLADLALSSTGACGEGALADIFPRGLGDLFEDQRLVVLGRYSGVAGGCELVVTGEHADGKQSMRAGLDPEAASPENSHIARLWAQQKVTWLIDELRSAGADPRVQGLESLREDPRLKELIDEIVMLSTRYGILTEYTAFLAAEESVLAGHAGLGTELGRVFQRANMQRSGATGLVLGESQNARRSAVQSGRPMSLDESRQISADAAAAPSEGGGVNHFAAGGEVLRKLAEPGEAPIRQVGPDTLYRQGDRWVGSAVILQARSLNEHEGGAADLPEPEETVQFGTERYFEIASRLASVGRQGLMSVPGDVEILFDGVRVLLRNPS